MPALATSTAEEADATRIVENSTPPAEVLADVRAEPEPKKRRFGFGRRG
jgi:hypothetical protein